MDTETREVLGVWEFEGFNKPRNKRHRTGREEFVFSHFGGKDIAPKFIWKVEFVQVAANSTVTFKMILHRFATNAKGSRHTTWVKGYNERGEAVNTKLVATVEPEEYDLPFRHSEGRCLPPDWLLRNTPE